jgi:hypothetical protein
MVKKIFYGTLILILSFVISKYEINGWEKYPNTTRLQTQIDIAHDILSGHAEWRAYQNRVLIPIIIKAIEEVSQKLSLSPLRGVEVFYTLILMSANAMVLNFSICRTKSIAFSLTAIAFSAAFFLCNSMNLTYPWDFGEFIILPLLCHALLTNSTSSATFYSAFFASLFNRESSTLFGIAIALIGIFRLSKNKQLGMTAIKNGAAMLAISTATTEALRRSLFADPNRDLQHATFSNHINFVQNIININNPITWLNSSALISASAAIMIFVATLLKSRRSQDVNASSLSWTMLFFTASIICFGAIEEIRIYQPLAWVLPYFLCYLINDPEESPSKASAATCGSFPSTKYNI